MRRLILAAALLAPLAANAGEPITSLIKGASAPSTKPDCSKEQRFYPMAWGSRGGDFLLLNADGSWTILDRPELRHARITMAAYADLFDNVLHKKDGIRVVDKARSDAIALRAGHRHCMFMGGL
jgi:hypothetical protein